MQPVPAHQSAMAKAIAERNIVWALRRQFIGVILCRKAQLVEEIQDGRAFNLMRIARTGRLTRL